MAPTTSSATTARPMCLRVFRWQTQTPRSKPAAGVSFTPYIRTTGAMRSSKPLRTVLLAVTANVGFDDTFVRDLHKRLRPRRVSLSDSGDSGGNGGYNEGVSITADGRQAVFVSDSTDLVASDTDSQPDVFLRDLQIGSTTRARLSPPSVKADNFSYGSPTSPPTARFCSSQKRRISSPGIRMASAMSSSRARNSRVARESQLSWTHRRLRSRPSGPGEHFLSGAVGLCRQGGWPALQINRSQPAIATNSRGGQRRDSVGLGA